MAFIIDEQTRSELALTGRHQPGTVYHLFNAAKTKSGANLLDEMLSNPLSDAKSINDRTAIFRHFGFKEYEFPIDSLALELFVEWLEEPVNRSWFGVWSQITKGYFLSVTVHDQNHEYQQKGLRAAICVLRQLKIFFETTKLKEVGRLVLPATYLEQIYKAEQALNDNRLEKLFNDSQFINGEINTRFLIRYSHLLKNLLGDDIRSLLSFIASLDTYISVSAIARERGFSYALALGGSDNTCRMTGLWHPLLKSAIANDLNFDGTRRMFFLTGPNMAGKSTLMKSFGVAVYLAHAGFPVPVQEMTFTVKDGLCTSINVPDNIRLGYSHYYAEVLRVKEIAHQLAEQKKMVIICDELFKGTNVKDAYDATLAVTKAFAQYRQCLFMVSTHIIEVAQDLVSDPAVGFGYMPTKMEQGKPVYSYKLTPGVTEDRHGMIIIKAEGILELLS